MKISSPSFEQAQPIPASFTCEGSDLSPMLVFDVVPKGIASFVLIMEDPDAPGGVFDHWLAWNIPPEARVLEEGYRAPREGINGFGSTGYRGPCPPRGKPHRYYFRLYALDIILDLPSGSYKERLLSAMKGHIRAQAEIMGTYQRQA
jgi:Raf kinase inhibitor-like YbhB/YbcL family protein